MSEQLKLDEVYLSCADIRAFLDWLVNDRKMVIAEYTDESKFLLPISRHTQDLVYGYFDIDPVKLEQERRSPARLYTSTRSHTT